MSPESCELMDEKNRSEIELGEQPLARLMKEHNLKTHDLVSASDEQITHKMVAKAAKGRRLTPHVQRKILIAFMKASGTVCALTDLFTY